LLKFWQDKQDRKHELQILDRQMEQMRLGHNQRLDEIAINADVSQSLALYKHDSQPSGVTWVDGLRASVRPMITYGFFILFAWVKLSAVILLMNQDGLNINEALIHIWDGETQALFAGILSFWFGSRSLAKRRSQ